MADVEVVIGAKEEVTEAANRASASLRSMGNTAEEAGGRSAGAASKSELAWLKKGVGVGVAIMALRKMIDYAQLAGGASAELKEQMEAFNKVTEDIKVNVGAFVVGAGAALIATFSLIGAAVNSVIGVIAKFISYILPFTEFIPALKSLKDGLEGVAANSFDAASAGLKYAEMMDKTAKSAFGLIGSLEGETEAMKKATAEKKKKADEEDKRRTAADREAQRLVEAEMKRQADIEGAIFKTAIATARLGASKEELINLQLIEAEAWNWSIDQIDRYRSSLESAAIKEGELIAAKEAAKIAAEAAKMQETARGELAGLGKAPTGMTPEDEFSKAWMEYDAKLLALNEYNTQRLLLMQAAGYSEAELTAENNRQILANEQAINMFRLNSAASTAGALSNILQNLMTAGLARGKTAFQAMKILAIAQAMIETFVAGTKALREVPYPANIAAMAAVIASGLAQVAKIKSTEPGTTAGGAISAGGAAMPAYGGGSFGAYPVPMREEVKPTQNITLQIYNPLSTQNWAEITENNILPALKAASDRNIVMNVQTVYA